MEEIGTARARATCSAFFSSRVPTNARNRKISRFITRHSCLQHTPSEVLPTRMSQSSKTAVILPASHIDHITRFGESLLVHTAVMMVEPRSGIFFHNSWMVTPWTAVTLHLNVFMHHGPEPCGVARCLLCRSLLQSTRKALAQGRTWYIKSSGQLLR